MKREYLALLVIFIVLIALSLWIATQISLPDIESRIGAHNESLQSSESLIEGGILPYLAVAVLLLAVGIIIYWVFGKRTLR